MTYLSSIHRHAPLTGFSASTSRACSTAALSCTGALNLTMIGMPTPTVSPLMPGVTSTTSSPTLGLRVVKRLVAAAGPPLPVALADTVYLAEGFSGSLEVHLV